MVWSFILLFIFCHESLGYDNFYDFDVVPFDNDQQLYYLTNTDETQNTFYNEVDSHLYPSNDDVDLERLLYTLTSDAENYHYTPALTYRNVIPSLYLPISLPSVNLPSFERSPYKSSYKPSLVTPPRTNTINFPFSSLNSYFTSPIIIPLNSISNSLSPSLIHSSFIDVSSFNYEPSVFGLESTLESVSPFGSGDGFKETVLASGSFVTSAQFGADGNTCSTYTTTNVPRILHTAGCTNNPYNPNMYSVYNRPVLPDIYTNTAVNPCNNYMPINNGYVNNIVQLNMYQEPYTTSYNNFYSGIEAVDYGSIDDINDGANYVPVSGNVLAKGRFTVASHF